MHQFPTGRACIEGEVTANRPMRKRVCEAISRLTGVSELCHTDMDTARALNAEPAYLSGVNDERRLRLVTNALEAFAPEDTAAVQLAVAVAREADQLEAGAANAGTGNVYFDAGRPFCCDSG